MNKITFKDLPDTTTPLNASNLNQVQDNVEDAIDGLETDLTSDLTNSTYAYTLAVSSSSLTASTWNTSVHTAITTASLPVGTYLIFSNTADFSASTTGLITASLMVDDSLDARTTFPLASLLQSSQILGMITFATATTHTINIRYFPNITCTASGTHILYLIRVRSN